MVLPPIRRGTRRGVAVVPATFLSEYPTFDEQYFSEDILLADLPILGEPDLEMLHNHRYITIRVGPDLAVHSINSEKFFNKSTYGKQLLSRMCKIPNGRSFRVDYPNEEEQIFINLIEWINYGEPTLYKDTFRGSFIRHLKLYILAQKYGIEGLAQLTFETITDMLVESHPEQMTRVLFWSTVVNLVYSRTEVGDDMRSVITGYTLWYMLHGRAKLFKTKSNTVKNALLALTTLPSTSPFYRIDCSIVHENLDYHEEILDRLFGGARKINPKLTGWWGSAIEDSLFEVWIENWGAIGNLQGVVEFLDTDPVALVKGVDDEDELSFRIEEKEVEQRIGGAKGAKSKSRKNHTKATKPRDFLAASQFNKACETTQESSDFMPNLSKIETDPSGLNLKSTKSQASVSNTCTFYNSFPPLVHQSIPFSLIGLGVGCSTERLEQFGIDLRDRYEYLEQKKNLCVQKIERIKFLKLREELEVAQQVAERTLELKNLEVEIADRTSRKDSKKPYHTF